MKDIAETVWRSSRIERSYARVNYKEAKEISLWFCVIIVSETVIRIKDQLGTNPFLPSTITITCKVYCVYSDDRTIVG